LENRYPRSDGIWEAGHSVVSLDPKERFCGCGGIGHLESIMGNRAIRLRFMDMEPEEVFANAKAGDPRCKEFVHLWHRALARISHSNSAGNLGWLERRPWSTIQKIWRTPLQRVQRRTISIHRISREHRGLTAARRNSALGLNLKLWLSRAAVQPVGIVARNSA
jgi:hypothetical protein